MSFQDKTIVITGGAKGIGGGCAEVFYRQKGQVVLLDRDEEAGRLCNLEIGLDRSDAEHSRGLRPPDPQRGHLSGRDRYAIERGGVPAVCRPGRGTPGDDRYSPGWPHMGTVEEIGEFVAFVAGEKGSFITGQALRIDGGIGVKLPGSVND